MLVCSTPVYKKVIEEYKHPHAHQEKRQDPKQAQSRSRSTSPIKSKRDDFYNYLAGQSSGYGSPDWHNKWNEESLLPTLQDDHRSHVLLPSLTDQVNSDRQTSKKRSASVTLNQTTSSLSASAQRLLHIERARSHRPHSAKTRNEQALRVKEIHATQANAIKDRPRSLQIATAKKERTREDEQRERRGGGGRHRERAGAEEQGERRAGQLQRKVSRHAA